MLLTWNSLEEISLFKFHFICTLLYLPHLFHHLSYWLISLQLALLFSLYQETTTGGTQNPTSWDMKVQHQDVAVMLQLQHQAEAESMHYWMVFFFCLLVCSKLNLTCRLFIDLLFPLRHFSVEYLNIFGTASTGQLVCLCCHQTIRISYAFILRIVWASYASLVTFLILLFMYRKRLIVID